MPQGAGAQRQLVAMQCCDPVRRKAWSGSGCYSDFEFRRCKMYRTCNQVINIARDEL